ncbi:FCD domain-containing protein [Streptomyces mirabilis]|nr:FCD domain-containing protein [Streptomyces sp. RLB1-33]QUW84795.1 FCD domain-containing protein [Streptomyces mirabilis]
MLISVIETRTSMPARCPASTASGSPACTMKAYAYRAATSSLRQANGLDRTTVAASVAALQALSASARFLLACRVIAASRAGMSSTSGGSESWSAMTRAQLVEVQAARLAAARRTPEDVTALAGRRAASAGDDAAFVDADIALHAAVVAAVHNPVLADLFREFVPALREGLIEMLDLVGMREHDPNTGDDAHAALVRAVADGDAETAGTVLRGELEETLALLRRP